MSTLPTYLFPTRENDPTNLELYEREVASGLPNQQAAFSEAMRNQALYDLDAIQYIPTRGSESSLDYEERPKRECGLTREVVDILCDHLYAPGPRRLFSDP